MTSISTTTTTGNYLFLKATRKPLKKHPFSKPPQHSPLKTHEQISIIESLYVAASRDFMLLANPDMRKIFYFFYQISICDILSEWHTSAPGMTPNLIGCDCQRHSSYLQQYEPEKTNHTRILTSPLLLQLLLLLLLLLLFLLLLLLLL